MMKFKNIFLLAAIVAFFAASCSKDDDGTVQFGVSESEVFFDENGGTYAIKLSAGHDWTVTSDREWCLVTPTNGVASTVCEIRVDSSYLYSEREAHVNFHCGAYTCQVKVSQLGYEKVIKLDKSEIEVDDYADFESLFQTVKVRANVDYEVLVEYADNARTGWLRPHKVAQGNVQSIPRPGEVRLDYDMYFESDADRIAKVIFRQTDAKQGDKPVESSLTFRQHKAKEIVPSREGDSLALLAVSRIMHLNTSWDASQPMIYWNGVTMKDVSYYNEKLKKTVIEPRVTGVSFVMFDTNESMLFHLRYLDQLRSLSFTANSNAHIKRIPLGDDVTYLENLESLTLLGYGIISLPERMKQMKKLRILELGGNNFAELPMDVITALDGQSLEYINFANNRRRDVFANLYANASVRDTLGLHGELPEQLFQLKKVRYIGLSYNYFEGSVPDMGYDASKYATLDEKVKNNPVMPQLEQLSINLNYLTGSLPDWLLYHPNLRCWDPYTLVFNQFEKSRDSKGRNTGFDNEPSSVEQQCHLWDDDEEEYSTTLLNTSNAAFGRYQFNRKNTFNSRLMYETLDGPVYR